MANLAAKVAYSTIYQTIGKILAVFLGLLQVYLLVQYFGANGYGQYAAVTAYFGLAIAISELGLHITNVTNISRPDADKSKVLSNAFTLRLTASLFVFGLATFIGFYFFPYDTTIKTGIIFASLAFLFLSVNQVFVGVFQKYFANHILVFGEIIAKIIVIIAIILLARANASITAVLASLNIAFAANLALTMFFAYRYIQFSFDFDFKYWKEMLSQSWPIAFSVVLNLIYFKADTVILSVYHNPTIVGIYSLPYKVIEVLIAFPALFAGLLLPLLSSAMHANQLDKFKNIIQQGFNVLVYAALLLGMEIFIFASDIIRIIARGRFNEFAESVPILRLLIIATVFLFVGNLFGHAVPALNLQKKMILGYASAAACGLALYFVLIPSMSYYGAAIGTIITEFIAGSYAMYLVLRKTKHSLLITGVVKAVTVTALLMFLGPVALAKLSLIPWFIMALIIAMIYTFALYLLGAIKKEHLLLLFLKR